MMHIMVYMIPSNLSDAPPAALTLEESQAWMPFVITTLRLLARLDSELKDAHDLSHLDFGILTLTHMTPNGQRRMSDLASTFGVDPSVITYRIRRMEARGWMERVDNIRDGRLVMAHITELGRSTLAQARPTHLKSVKQLFLDQIEPNELAVLTRIFGRILALQNQPKQAVEPEVVVDLI